MQQPNELILKVNNLKKHFPIKSSIPFRKSTQFVKAVDGVSFELFKGETLGIVGESGCGKSTVARLINQLIAPTEGIVEFKGTDLASLNTKDIRSARKSIQMVFQNPYASLDPRKTIEYLIAEPLVIHGIGDESSRKKRVMELLETVGLSAYHAKRYPHEFSGGQRQRINIARALALQPDIVVCDEPVSALDVSVQAQILNLFQSLQKELELTYIFIAHDLSVVKHISDRIGVMYLGRMVEFADKNQLFADPLHPYTKSLMSSVPIPNPESEKKDRIILTGDVPNPVNPPLGCTFHPRCFACMEVCRTKKPRNIEVKPGHFVACHLFEPERMVVRD